MRRQECGSNAMVTVQMTVEEYLEMKSRQEAKAVTMKQKNLVYGLEGIKTLNKIRVKGKSRLVKSVAGPTGAVLFKSLPDGAVLGAKCMIFRTDRQCFG